MDKLILTVLTLTLLLGIAGTCADPPEGRKGAMAVVIFDPQPWADGSDVAD